MMNHTMQKGSASSDEIMSRLLSWFSGVEINVPVYLVGGCVRDILMGNRAADLDLASPRAESLARELARANWAGLVRMEKAPKAPCYRVVKRNDPDNFLDVVGLRGPDIESDLHDRDFTINAMAITFDGIGYGQIVDPLSGRSDIADKRIRAVSLKNLKDDPLRILRGFRFAAQLGFAIDPQSLKDFSAAAPGLSKTANERVTREILHLLASPESLGQILSMDRAGVLQMVFPELTLLKGVGQNEYHHEDVWNHTLGVFGQMEAIVSDPAAWFGEASANVTEYIEKAHNLPVLKLAALFHDAGKPRARAVRPDNGAVTFYGHEKFGAEIVRDAGIRLKMSNADVGLWEQLVAEHIHAEDLLKDGVREKTILSWFRKMGEHAVSALILAMADAASKEGPKTLPEEREKRSARACELVRAYYGSIRKRLEMKPLVTGGDILALGLPPGPEVGRLLALVQDAWDEGLVKTREDALSLVKGDIGPLKKAEIKPE